MQAPKPCNQAGCKSYSIEGGRCEAHKKLKQQQSDQARGSSNARGYGYKWQQTSKGYLKQHPLCECQECLAGERQVNQATVVDHIKPHKGDMVLFWDRANWQAMAKPCHDKKTARENGGFGR
jgi:5-methylcytosine-specific restriction enzyme A